LSSRSVSRDLQDGRLLVVLFLFCLAFFALAEAGHCADLTRPSLPPGPIEWRSSYLVESAGGGAAHICAVGPFLAYTARHVVENVGEAAEWRLGATTGRLKVMQRYNKRDLVSVLSDTPFPYFSPVAADAPLMGADLWLRGFLWRLDNRVAYRSQVIGLDHDNELSSAGPSGKGASGSCVWNAAGQVVAIHTSAVMYGQQPYVFFMSNHEPVWGDWREAK
jgi:hypothetical protein